MSDVYVFVILMVSMLSLFEKDPLEGKVEPGKFSCNAAFRKRNNYYARFDVKLLICRARVRAKTKLISNCTVMSMKHCGALSVSTAYVETFISNAMLFEFVQYRVPANVPRHPHSLLK